MRLVHNRAAINKRGGLAAPQLRLTDEEMNRNALRRVFDDFPTALASRCRCVLALPVERVLVDPMIVIPMLLGLALLVQGHKKDMRLLVIEHDMTDVPNAGIEGLAE